MKINSNTIKLEKESFENLEEIIKKIASENKIENVENIEIKLSKESGTVKFAIIDDWTDDVEHSHEDEYEQTVHGNNLEQTIGLNPERNAGGYFNPIEIGTIDNHKVTLSVQGSYDHYSAPQRTLPLNQYDEMEVAVVVDGKLLNEEQMVQIGIPKEFARKVGFDETVFPYLPVKEIEELYNILKQIVSHNTE